MYSGSSNTRYNYIDVFLNVFLVLFMKGKLVGFLFIVSQGTIDIFFVIFLVPFMNSGSLRGLTSTNQLEINSFNSAQTYSMIGKNTKGKLIL